MNVKIKKLTETATIPKYAKASDAGLDLVATSRSVKYNEFTRDSEYIEYGTGLAVEIPEGYVGLIFPRSSISNTDLTLTNSVGVIDSGYRGEIKARFRVTRNERQYQIGERIAQMIVIPYPSVEFEEVEELSSSERGTGGFGSSGS